MKAATPSAATCSASVLVHPDAGVWTYAHTIDSEVPDALSTWQTARAIDTQAVHIPIAGAGVPKGLATLATSDWTPYDWSTNNVVTADVAHAALAQWEAQRPVEGFALWKGAMLDTMFMAGCPGNLDMLSQFDANRGESQRDFGDPTGMGWRAMVEGLFGLRPDALAGELKIQPGFPEAWDHASIHHPDVAVAFRRSGATDDTYDIDPHFPKPMRLRLRLRVRGDGTPSVRVNGKPATWANVDDAVGGPALDVIADAAEHYAIAVTWNTATPAAADDRPQFATVGDALHIATPYTLLDVADPQDVLANLKTDDHGASATVTNAVGPHTIFLHARSNGLTWWQPYPIDVHPTYAIDEAAVDAAGRVSFRLFNNMPRLIKSEDLSVRVDGQPMKLDADVDVDTLGRSEPIRPQGPAATRPGVHRIEVTIAGTVEVTKIPTQTIVADAINWQTRSDNAQFDTVNLAAAFNDSVTQVFKNRYESPRSPYCSLAMPVQGFGGWATNKLMPTIDDAGLRAGPAGK